MMNHLAISYSVITHPTRDKACYLVCSEHDNADQFKDWLGEYENLYVDNYVYGYHFVVGEHCYPRCFIMQITFCGTLKHLEMMTLETRVKLAMDDLILKHHYGW